MLAVLSVFLTALVATPVIWIPGCCASLIHRQYNASLISSIPSTGHYGVDGLAIDNDLSLMSRISHFHLLNHSQHSALPTPQPQQCSLGEHRCYYPVYRVSTIKPDSCTGTFVPDDDYHESKPNPDGFWGASRYLYDNTQSWWTTRVDGIPLDSTRCEQVGLKTPTYALSIDWLSMYSWFRPDGNCFHAGRGASAVRMECVDDSGRAVPVIFFWHFMPVVLATVAPTGATSLSTITRIGLDYECQWSWTVVLINIDCGPYHPIVKGGDCNHSFCVKKP